MNLFVNRAYAEIGLSKGNILYNFIFLIVWFFGIGVENFEKWLFCGCRILCSIDVVLFLRLYLRLMEKCMCAVFEWIFRLSVCVMFKKFKLFLKIIVFDINECVIVIIKFFINEKSLICVGNFLIKYFGMINIIAWICLSTVKYALTSILNFCKIMLYLLLSKFCLIWLNSCFCILIICLVMLSMMMCFGMLLNCIGGDILGFLSRTTFVVCWLFFMYGEWCNVDDVGFGFLLGIEIFCFMVSIFIKWFVVWCEELSRWRFWSVFGDGA